MILKRCMPAELHKLIDHGIASGQPSVAVILMLEGVDGLSLNTEIAVVVELSRGGISQLLISENIDAVAGLAEITISALLNDCGASLINLSLPWVLQRLSIEKPWGQELWYTGIEPRGVNKVLAEQGPAIALPYLMQALPYSVSGFFGEPPILLKILDPHAEEVYGDLYFELHEEKQEVYIVTKVDGAADEQGKGAIKIGFDQRRRSDYESDQAFKNAYIAAVEAYREVRVAIDKLVDQMRATEGVGPSDAVAASRTKVWISALPQELQQQEHSLRLQMDSFTALHSIDVGDVIVIPRFVPHALQHGVRTVEFQTPVYERQIVSFAQKVLTQSHWDTRAAVAQCSLEPYAAPNFQGWRDKGVSVSRIVDFEEFEAFSVRLDAGASFLLEATGGYGLVMLIEGDASVAGREVSVEEAQLLTATIFPCQLQAREQNSVILVAFPILPAEVVEGRSRLWHNLAR